MKTSILFLILLSVPFEIDCKDTFKIIEATSQKWYGGRQEIGYGTNFEITIVSKVNSEILVFDKLWLGTEYFDIQTFQKGKRIKNNTFGPGDTITILIEKKMSPEPMPFVEEDNHRQDPPPPYEYDGRALLSYQLKSKRKYKIIKQFKKLEDLRYP
jgi:hypothetical protein